MNEPTELESSKSEAVFRAKTRTWRNKEAQLEHLAKQNQLVYG